MDFNAKPPSKILELKTPPITSYPMHAHTLSLVLRDEDEPLQWYFEYYIQLFAGKDISDACYVDFCAPLPWKSCPWIYHQKISRELMGKGWRSVVDFLMDAIDSGYYTFLFLDRFFLPQSVDFNKRRYPHDILVYGYDSDEKVFYIADFGQAGKYGRQTAHFQEIEKAFLNLDLTSVNDALEGIILMSPTKQSGYTLSNQRICGHINDFLSSRMPANASREGYWADIYQNRDAWCFGMEVYSLLQEHLEQSVENPRRTDIRAFHVLVDHSKLMLLRIKYLADHGRLNNGAAIYSDCEKLQRQTLILQNLVVKSSWTENPKLLARPIGMISETAEMERGVLESILQNIIIS